MPEPRPLAESAITPPEIPAELDLTIHVRVPEAYHQTQFQRLEKIKLSEIALDIATDLPEPVRQNLDMFMELLDCALRTPDQLVGHLGTMKRNFNADQDKLAESIAHLVSRRSAAEYCAGLKQDVDDLYDRDSGSRKEDGDDDQQLPPTALSQLPEQTRALDIAHSTPIELKSHEAVVAMEAPSQALDPGFVMAEANRGSGVIDRIRWFGRRMIGGVPVIDPELAPELAEANLAHIREADQYLMNGHEVPEELMRLKVVAEMNRWHQQGSARSWRAYKQVVALAGGA